MLHPSHAFHADPIPMAPTNTFLFGMSGVKFTRIATPEDLASIDLTRLVCACQDGWHVLDRMMRQVSKNSPDYKKFRGRVSEVLRRASAAYGLIQADTPADLQEMAEREAMKLQSELLGLIAEFRTTVPATTTQERLHTCMEQLGTCYGSHSGIAAAPPEAECSETMATMYGHAIHFKCVNRFDVRFRHLSVRRKSLVCVPNLVIIVRACTVCTQHGVWWESDPSKGPLGSTGVVSAA